MASTHLRSNLYDVPVSARTSRPIADLMGLAVKPAHTASFLPSPTLTPKALKRRARIWELNSNLHCSIIGTCLSAGELKRLLVRLKVPGIETADEHELHMLGVLLADRPKEGAKLLQKALDRRHQGALNQFAKAKDDAAVAALWERSMAGGDIPGAYWAVMTHTESSDKLVQKAFSDVHMLSHLMGATNCADLRRMHLLEDEVAALLNKLERQQKHLRDGFTERDQKIDRLTKMLAEKIQTQSDQSVRSDDPEIAGLRATIADLNKCLARETARRERLEQRQKAADDLRNARLQAEQERDALRTELDLVERQIESLLPSGSGDQADRLQLAGSTILYVGGRPHQIPQLKALVEQADGQFIHHDGGVEHAAALLPGLISRSDITVFPVDCISHNAMTSTKRACQQSGKPYVALRTSSLACLLSALSSRARPVAVSEACN